MDHHRRRPFLGELAMCTERTRTWSVAGLQSVPKSLACLCCVLAMRSFHTKQLCCMVALPLVPTCMQLHAMLLS